MATAKTKRNPCCDNPVLLNVLHYSFFCQTCNDAKLPSPNVAPFFGFGEGDIHYFSNHIFFCLFCYHVLHPPNNSQTMAYNHYVQCTAKILNNPSRPYVCSSCRHITMIDL